MRSTSEIYREMAGLGKSIIARWEDRQSDAGDAFMELGSKGQFPEIHRKVKKIKRAVWEGYELRGEPVEQVIEETIHHLIMMLWLIHEETGEHVVDLSGYVPHPPGASEEFKAGIVYALERSGRV